MTAVIRIRTPGKANWSMAMAEKKARLAEKKAEAASVAVESARKRLIRCLNRLCVLGLKTNQHQLIEILSHPDFIQGEIHTRWLESQDQNTPEIPDTAAIAALCGQLKNASKTLPSIAKGWRNSRFRSQIFSAGDIDVHWHPKGNGWSVRTGEQHKELHFESAENAIVLWIDGRKTEAVLAEAPAAAAFS